MREASNKTSKKILLHDYDNIRLAAFSLNVTRQTKVLTRLTRSLVHPVVQQAHRVLSSAQLLLSEISLIGIRHLRSERWSTEILLLGLENHRHSFSALMNKQVNVQIDRVRGCIVSLVEYFSSRTDPQSGTAPNRADHRHEQHSLQRGRTADERGEWEWERNYWRKAATFSRSLKPPPVVQILATEPGWSLLINLWWVSQWEDVCEMKRWEPTCTVEYHLSVHLRRSH